MSPLTIAAHTAAVAAIAALVWTIIGHPRRSRSPAVQAVALTGPTITAILHKGENLDANLTGATNPDIILWIASIIWWLIPLMLLMVATYPKPGHDTGWINAPIRILQEWTMGKALLMTVATAGLIMVPWLWHAIDPRYETPFLTTIQPWMAAGLLLTAAGISVHYARRKNETAEDAAVVRAGQIIYYAARGVGKVVDHTALAAYTIALTALVVASRRHHATAVHRNLSPRGHPAQDDQLLHHGRRHRHRRHAQQTDARRLHQTPADTHYRSQLHHHRGADRRSSLRTMVATGRKHHRHDIRRHRSHRGRNVHLVAQSQHRRTNQPRQRPATVPGIKPEPIQELIAIVKADAKEHDLDEILVRPALVVADASYLREQGSIICEVT